MRTPILTAVALAALCTVGACAQEDQPPTAVSAPAAPAPAPGPEASPAAAFRNDMPANVWTQVKPKYEPPPDAGKHLPQGWNKMTYDPVGKRVVSKAVAAKAGG